MSSDYELELARAMLPMLESQASLYEFTKQAWPFIAGPNKPFIDGWHFGAICEHLEACKRRQIRNLLILCPPRTAKSSILSVALPAWWWLDEPGTQFLYASYGLQLAIRDSIKSRSLIESNWYQKNWGHLFSLSTEQNTKQKFENNRYGYRACISSGSGTTGLGSDVRIVDDPNNVVDSESDVIREGINDWWSGAFSTRYNDIEKDINIIAQQRTNARDLSGHVMNIDVEEGDIKQEWTRLVLPMEFETKTRCKTIILPSTKGKVWEDPRKVEGEILWPARITPLRLQQLKRNLGTAYRIAGQLQQRPSPEEGGIFKRSFWKMWKKPNPPKIEYVLQSWDFAMEAKKMNDFSACVTLGVFNDDFGIANVILLSSWHGKYEFPDLVKMVKRLSTDYRDDGSLDITPDGKHVPNIILIEEKASGNAIRQEFSRKGILVFGFNPNRKDLGDKVKRARIVSNFIEGGRVHMPCRPPGYTEPRGFAKIVIDELADFPNGAHDDFVDAMTQGLIRLRDSGWLGHPDDRRIDSIATKPTHGFYGVENDG